MRGLGNALNGLAVALAVAEAPACQAGQALAECLGPLGPGPHEQADAGGFGVAQPVTVHQPRHLAARIEPAMGRLHMAVEAPIEFALQYQVDRLR